jgi:hypothetical protein
VAGALKTFMQMLSSSAYMAGVSVCFGEEEQHDASKALPMVVVIPTGGPVMPDGYARGSDPDIESKWKVLEQLDVKCWAYDTTPGAGPIDHTDATEALLVLVLSALQDQRMNKGFVAASAGLQYKPTSGRWELMQGAFSRYGRGYTLSVTIEKTYAMGPPPELSNPVLSLTATLGIS